jgi:hypothetical protein
MSVARPRPNVSPKIAAATGQSFFGREEDAGADPRQTATSRCSSRLIDARR